MGFIDDNSIEWHIRFSHPLPVEAVINGNAVVLTSRLALDASGVGVN